MWDVDSAKKVMDAAEKTEGYASGAYQKARVNFHHAGSPPNEFEAWTVWHALDRALAQRSKKCKLATEMSWREFAQGMLSEGSARVLVSVDGPTHPVSIEIEVCAWRGEDGQLTLEVFDGERREPSDRLTELLRYQFRGPGLPKDDPRSE